MAVRDVDAVNLAEVLSHGTQEAARSAADFERATLVCARAVFGEALQFAGQLTGEGLWRWRKIPRQPDRGVRRRRSSGRLPGRVRSHSARIRAFAQAGIYRECHAAIAASCQRASGFSGHCSSFVALSTRQMLPMWEGVLGRVRPFRVDTALERSRARCRVERLIRFRRRSTNRCDWLRCRGNCNWIGPPYLTHRRLVGAAGKRT